MEFDVSLGEKPPHFIKTVMVFDADVELDSARQKTALASFTILKIWNHKAKCTLVHVTKETDYAILELARY